VFCVEKFSVLNEFPAVFFLIFLHPNRFLIKHGGDVSLADREGRTVLHCACSCGSVNIAKAAV